MPRSNRVFTTPGDFLIHNFIHSEEWASIQFCFYFSIVSNTLLPHRHTHTLYFSPFFLPSIYFTSFFTFTKSARCKASNAYFKSSPRGSEKERLNLDFCALFTLCETTVITPNIKHIIRHHLKFMNFSASPNILEQHNSTSHHITSSIQQGS